MNIRPSRSRRSPREFRADLGWTWQEEWRSAPAKNQAQAHEFFGYEKWKEAALLFRRLAKAYPSQLLIARYADLLQDTAGETAKVFAHFGLEMTSQTTDFIGSSTAETKGDAYSVYRGKSAADNKWEAELPAEISAAVLADLSGTSLEEYL